jgi:hypothetical protein
MIVLQCGKCNDKDKHRVIGKYRIQTTDLNLSAKGFKEINATKIALIIFATNREL